jgi:hypothetical protein
MRIDRRWWVLGIVGVAQLLVVGNNRLRTTW